MAVARSERDMGLRASASRTPYCCGLFEIGAFNPEYDYGARVTRKELKTSGYSYICVTRRSDITQRTWLKFAGFKIVGRWRNPNTGRWLTLWARFPPRKKKGKK